MSATENEDDLVVVDYRTVPGVSNTDIDRTPTNAELGVLVTARAKIAANRSSGRYTYDGLTSDEIARYNRALMFGDNDEAFPSQEEWSRIVD